MTQRVYWYWALCILVCVLVLLLTDYNSRDPDSQFYVLIVEQLAQRPWREWITPTWMGFFRFGQHEIIKDHLVGHFIPALLLTRLGFPAAQSLYAINFVYQAACLGLFSAIARTHFSSRISTSLILCLLFSPIAFLYRARANHETLVLLCVLLGIYAALRMRQNAVWVLLFACACHVSFLAKGIIFVMVPACAGLTLLIHGQAMGTRRIIQLSFLLGIAMASVALTAFAYEAAFQRATGESFFAGYWKLQIVQRSMGEKPMPAIIRTLEKMGYVFEGELPTPIRKFANLFYYLGTVLWMAAPWSLALAACLSKRVRAHFTPALHNQRSALLGVLVFGVPALFHVILFSASNRLALRYIYPAHWCAAAAGACLYLSTRKQKSHSAALMEKLEAQPEWIPIVFMALTCATLLTTGAA